MMKNKLWLRFLALCLAIACTFSMVAALTYDTDDNGRVDIWELQVAGEDGNYDAALLEVLGGHDELHPNADGVYEIYSPLGLYNMAKLATKGYTFKLMCNIDMGGIDWKPTGTFQGTFNGNGKTISNVNITKDVKQGSSYCQGFFSKIGKTGEVNGLNLEMVTVTASESTQFIGLLAGSSFGKVVDCTTTGQVIDNRTSLDAIAESNGKKIVYVGTLLGRIERNSNEDDTYEAPAPTISEGKLLRAEDSDLVSLVRTDTGDYQKMTLLQDALDKSKETLYNAVGEQGQGVVSKMGMKYATLTGENESRKTGVVGWAPTSEQYLEQNWQDISGSIQLQNPELADRRKAVVAKMYTICSISWTPSQPMTIHYYKDSGYTDRTWSVGTTYHGIPYNHGASSLEQFESYRNPNTGILDESKTLLPTVAYYVGAEAAAALNKGSYTYSSSITIPKGIYASDTFKDGFKVGETVEAMDQAGFNRYIGNDCSSAIMWAWRDIVSSDVKNGGTVINGVNTMTPTTANQTKYGVQPINGLVPTEPSETAFGALYTSAGQVSFMEAYAKASMGDAIIVENADGGHSRMLAYDPITISNYQGVIDATKSYVVTHEQGRDSSGTGWSSSCTVNKVYTYEQLTEFDQFDGGKDGIGTRGYYIPMTIPALNDVTKGVKTPTVTVSGTKVTSNYYILSTAVDGGQPVFSGYGQHRTLNATNYVGEGYRNAWTTVDIAAVHNMTAEQLSGTTVTVVFSNGESKTVTLN